MSSFPTLDEMALVQARVASFLGRPAGVRDLDLLRAVLLGVRIRRQGGEAPSAEESFERAAALLQQIVTLRPFVAANGATALAAAALYLSRHGHALDLSPGQGAAVVAGLRGRTMEPGAVVALLRLAARRQKDPSRPATTTA